MQPSPQLTEAGFTFRDLNKNGKLDPYEDPRRPIEERVEDLLSQMTLAEKAGLMFQNFAAHGPEAAALVASDDIGQTALGQMIVIKCMNHFNYPAIPDPRTAAVWQNKIQALAESTRLGIPVTFASDPRHSFSNNPLASMFASGFSQWPEPIGLAAIGDPALTQQFGDIARQEYVAVGIRVAIHPMADLATEPRWGRINGTFGEDAELSARLTAAYIRGFQGETLGPQSVACMTKHFPGGGPQKDGEDPHFTYGKDQIYPGNNFDYHLIPFEAAFAAGTAQIMPYYGKPVGLAYEEVGFGFSKEIITDLLRGKYGFDGVVCTDYGLVTDSDIAGHILEARAWGVEHLSRAERVKRLLEAGNDILGGESCPELIVELVTGGQIPEARLDESVRRILRDKFRLGLFDNPYVDPDAAAQRVGNVDFVAAAELAQRKSLVLLQNGATTTGKVLPLQGKPKLYIENIAPEVASAYGQVVERPEDADFAILRLNAPYEPRTGFLQNMIHSGDLDFKGDRLTGILNILAKAPTIVDIYLDRPAVIPEIAEQSAALIANFGANDRALLDVIFGRFAPVGKLPFELPSSMEAVRQQKPDVPYDSANPLFAFGHGLTYA
ncbi:MAG: glycoside hydrolase family 3 N-terminal domain-containing protein [Caldilineaceae bacterium]